MASKFLNKRQRGGSGDAEDDQSETPEIKDLSTLLILNLS
jgi:hypothetical protein